MQNFKTLRQPLLGDLAEGWREREKRERKIMPSLMVTSPSAQRRSDQNLNVTCYKLSLTRMLVLHEYFQMDLT